MKSRKALADDIHIVTAIVHDTIKEIYPHYYPLSVVDFFISHHNEDNIKSNIQNGSVYLFSIDNNYIGTATIENNHINRVFVLPDYQKQGCGTAIMDFCESIIALKFTSAVLDSSMPAYGMYCKRGYRSIEYNCIATAVKDILCYHVMSKELTNP